MRKLNAIPFSLKLPVIIAGLCLLSSLTVAVLGYADSRRSMVTQAQHSFDILIDERAQALENLFATLEIDLRNLVASPATLSAAQALGSSFHLMTDPASLQAAYGANNPNPVGQRHLLDQAAEALPYNFQHGAFHPGLRQTLETTGFDDIFLVSPDGDVIYSVTKAADFASNLETGTFRETGLGQAFRAARYGGRDAFSFTDFAPYGPRGNDVLSFLSAQILNAEGGVAGEGVAVRDVDKCALRVTGRVQDVDGVAAPTCLIAVLEGAGLFGDAAELGIDSAAPDFELGVARA